MKHLPRLLVVGLALLGGVSDPSARALGVLLSPSAASLAAGTYVMIGVSGTAVDGGFGYWGGTPGVELYQIYSGNPFQEWTYDNSGELTNGGWARAMIDPGNGTVDEAPSGDSWTILSAGAGYTVQNNRTGRYLIDNSGTLAMGAYGAGAIWTLQIVGGGAFSLSATPTSVAPGGTLTTSWTAPSGQTSAQDWIALYSTGSADTSYLSWQYTGGATSGSLNFVAPATPGAYEFRYFLNNGWTKVATSNGVTVTGGGGGTTTINDDDASIIYSTKQDNTLTPHWYFGGNSGYYQGDEHYSSVTGASLVVNFSGTGIAWQGMQGPNLGIATYSVDGGALQSVDTYSPSTIYANINLTISGLNSGSHSLAISVSGNRNPKSTGTYITVDAFIITGTPLAPSQGSTAGYNSPAISFSGTWTCGAGNPGVDLSGGHCYTPQANASMSWTFTGSLIEVFGRPDLEDGYFNVYIDGNWVTQIDGHYPSITVDNDLLCGIAMYQAKVGYGTHTITIVNTGTRDPNATGTFTQIDLFVAFP